MQSFKIVAQRNARGSFVGWAVHPVEQHPHAQIYPLYEMAEAFAILQRDGELDAVL